MKKLITPYRKPWLSLLLIILLAALTFQLTLQSSVSGSALLYVGIPFVIAVLLALTADFDENASWKMRYWYLVRNSLIVMLGSSVLLREGFLCVLMFMPIYFGVILVVFTYLLIVEKLQAKKNKNYVHVLPVIILISAIEGLHPNLSFERYNEVSSTKIVMGDIEAIKENLKKPIQLEKKRNWFLAMFPMPYKVEAQTLESGDIHTIYYRYHRWFFTNTHEGRILLKISEVADDVVRTEILEDTSYLSNYMRSYGTEVNLRSIDDKRTEVTLTIKYERLLDPAWYFGPLQEFGVAKMADFLVDEIIVR